MAGNRLDRKINSAEVYNSVTNATNAAKLMTRRAVVELAKEIKRYEDAVYQEGREVRTPFEIVKTAMIRLGILTPNEAVQRFVTYWINE